MKNTQTASKPCVDKQSAIELSILQTALVLMKQNARRDACVKSGICEIGVAGAFSRNYAASIVSLLYSLYTGVWN